MLSAHKIFFHGDKSKVKDQVGGGEGALGKKSGGMGGEVLWAITPFNYCFRQNWHTSYCNKNQLET